MIQPAKIACARMARTPLAMRFVGRLERRESAPALRLRVLTYHRIGKPEQNAAGDPKLFSATPEAFRAQLDVLAEHYNVVSIDQVLAAVGEGRLLPPRAVLITFDDAYPDFQDLAWPMLRERQLPVILFVPTAYPDCAGADFWWDRLARAVRNAEPRAVIDEPCGRFVLNSRRRRDRAVRVLSEFIKTLPHEEAMDRVDRLCEQLDPSSVSSRCSPPGSHPAARPTTPSDPPRIGPPRIGLPEIGSPEIGPATLGWNALRRLREQGVAVGVHTRTHPLLNRVSGKRLEDEVYGAKQDLETELGTCPPVFAYPAGAAGPEAVRVVRAAGFKIGLTTRPGINVLDLDEPLELRRFHVGLSTTASLLRTRLALR